MNKRNEVMKSRLEDRTEYSTMMSELEQKISRTSVISVEETSQRVKEVRQKRKEDFTVIIIPKLAPQDMSGRIGCLER